MAKKTFATIAWTLIILVNFYFIYQFPFRHFNRESWNEPFGPLLTVHILFGTLAILAGPFQFFPAIRKKHPRIHRTTGRIYLVSVLMAAIAATILAIADDILVQHRLVFGVGLLGLAAAWFVTSGMAYRAVRIRNFVQHREWMVKSYVVTCGFTTFRIFAVTIARYFEIDYKQEMSNIMAWACWSIPLLITEAWLQAKKLKRPATTPRPLS